MTTTHGPRHRGRTTIRTHLRELVARRSYRAGTRRALENIALLEKLGPELTQLAGGGQ